MKDTLEIEQNENLDDEDFRLNKYDISAYPADYTIKTLLEKFKGTIIVPEFQRGYVWGTNKIKQSRLIESFLLRLPVPQIFLFQKKKEKNMLLIDGFQRVNTLYEFYNDNIKLKGVQEQWEGKTYSDLDEIDQEELDNSTLRAIIIRQIEPDNDNSSMFYIFERLNTGGVTLSSMEIRKAIFYGDFFLSLSELNEDENWRLITGKRSNDQRLRDIEWLLRIISLLQGHGDYQSPMKNYLNNFMSKNFQSNFNEVCLRLKESFKLIIEALSPKPFHIPKGRLNIAAMDAFIVNCTRKQLTIKSIKNKYDILMQSEEFNNLITARDTSTTEMLRSRFLLVDKIFNGKS
ncbi:MAG: DUF262 domain-containing protein [Candidatus Electrothrix sp. AX1]|nr:DUF262 domain-containing protein [Candidatus Electrothrix sp. AX1]